MRKIIMMPAIAVISFGLTPAAFAQANQQQSGSPGSSMSGSQSSSMSDSQSSAMSGTRSYGEVESSLKKAGLQNVRTLDAAYLIRATTQDGEQVSLMVDPIATAGASASGSQSSGEQQAGRSSTGGQAGSDQAGSSQNASLQSQQQIRDNLTKAGFKNVEIVGASYLAAGTTAKGDRITMVIDPQNANSASGSSGMNNRSDSGSMGSSSSATTGGSGSGAMNQDNSGSMNKKAGPAQ